MTWPQKLSVLGHENTTKLVGGGGVGCNWLRSGVTCNNERIEEMFIILFRIHNNF